MKISKPVKAMRVMCGLVLCLICCIVCRLDAKALTIDYDETKQEIIISGVPETNNDYFYSMYGNLKYKGELVESFCYGTPGAPYDIPSKQAYIFRTCNYCVLWNVFSNDRTCCYNCTFSNFNTFKYYSISTD